MTRGPRPGEVAWIALVPCAIVIFAGIVWLGPVIGHAFLGPGSERLWPANSYASVGRPEPVKHGRYAIAALGPALLATVILASGRITARAHLRPGAIRALVAIGQLSAGAFLAVALLGQNNDVFAAEPPLWPIFSVRTLETALALALVILICLRSGRVAHWVARGVRETLVHRIVSAVVAAACTAAWLLTTVNSDFTIASAKAAGLMYWTLDDPLAVLNGRTPLVNFHAMYAQLWPYLAAAPMYIFGATITVYTLVMAIGSAAALLMIYAVLRRIVRSSLLALLLYLPILASGFLLLEPTTMGLSNVLLASMWPMRYGGAYLVAWLTARHLDGSAPRGRWLPFLVAGLVVIDNLEFGLGAFAGALVAVLCTQSRWSPRALGRLVGNAALGLLCAALLVALLTFVHAGELPHFSYIFEFPRIFGALGAVSMPMPTAGFQLAIYATFAAAIVVAAVRVARGDAETVLTGMLAWSGTFGLIAASYYLGRSDTFKLVSLFSAWAFSLALLVVVVVRSLAARSWRRPGLAELMVLFGFGLAVCSVREIPAPWSELRRLHNTTPTAVYKQPEAASFIDARTRPGEHVAILIALGHRIAYDLGIVNVAPYAFIESMLTRSQMRTFVNAIHSAHAHKIFLTESAVAPQQFAVLKRAGFSRRPSRGPSEYSEWSDASATH